MVGVRKACARRGHGTHTAQTRRIVSAELAQNKRRPEPGAAQINARDQTLNTGHLIFYISHLPHGVFVIIPWGGIGVSNSKNSTADILDWSGLV